MNKKTIDVILLVIIAALAVIGASCFHVYVIQPCVLSNSFTTQVQDSIKSVVHIECPKWQGSGFIIDKHMVGTARHVVEGVESFIITTNDGKQYHSTRAVSDKKHDVGFIWVEEVMDNVVELGLIKDCVLGQEVYAIGSPFGKVNFNSLTKGIISGLDRDWDFTNPWSGEKYGWEIAFTTDSAGHPGNSGCPVFTMDGKVRGILVGGFSPVLICVMPCDIFLPDLEQIKRMFIQDKYYFEEEPESTYVGYSDEWGSIVNENK